MSIKPDMYSKFIKPQGRVMRILDSLFVFVAGLACLVAYYVVEYILCVNNVCEKLEFTKIWANGSSLYIVFGLSLIAVSGFIFNSKELPKLYGIAITLVSLIGFMYCVSIVFAIARELNAIT